MKTTIINHEGLPAIAVPQPLLDACHLGSEVEVEAVGGCLIVRPTQSARAGWDEAFGRMAASGEDKLILNDSSGSQWDDQEWEW